MFTIVSPSTMTYGNELEELSTLEELLTGKTIDRLPFVKLFIPAHRTSWLTGELISGRSVEARDNITRMFPAPSRAM